MILILVVAIAALLIAIDTIRLGISPMPSSRKARKALLGLIRQGTVYELGSGWGTLAIPLSQKTTVRAFEKALIPWAFSLLRKYLGKATPLSIERRDFFTIDLKEADVIVCYLYPAAMKKLLPKFQNELKKGAVVLSNSFQIPGRKAEQIIEVNDWMGSKIYCYYFSQPGDGLGSTDELAVVELVGLGVNNSLY